MMWQEASPTNACPFGTCLKPVADIRSGETEHGTTVSPSITTAVANTASPPRIKARTSRSVLVFSGTIPMKSLDSSNATISARPPETFTVILRRPASFSAVRPREDFGSIPRGTPLTTSLYRAWIDSRSLACATRMR